MNMPMLEVAITRASRSRVATVVAVWVITVSGIATVDTGLYEQPTEELPQLDTAHIDFSHAFYIAQCDRRAIKLVA